MCESFEQVVRTSSALLPGAAGIALANELGLAYGGTRVNNREVIDAVQPNAHANVPFYLRAGLGGRRIPLDPRYPIRKTREFERGARLTGLVDSATVVSAGPEATKHHLIPVITDMRKPLVSRGIVAAQVIQA